VFCNLKVRKYMIKGYFGLLVFMFLLLSANELLAQKRYWVFFADKNGVEFDPYKYFDPLTIQKREARQIPLVQFSDLPVRQDYLDEVQKIAGNLGTISRWFNAVAVSTDKRGFSEISKLASVTDIREIKTVTHEASHDFNTDLDLEDDELRESQLKVLGAKDFEERGLNGKGVRIAVFDGGFPGVDTSPMFEHLRDSDRIIATWDFVKKNEFVYGYNSHGTSVLTCIAGQIEDKKFGLATGAEFLLARTEVNREVFSEEENWLAAVEWADKNGADIISSSLGYTSDRYFPKQMDGNYTLVSRSANLAASKGMLVINSAGNDGDKKWEIIGAPADADSVLSIGGVSPQNGYHINFSSFGPTSDGRMKPNLSAFGQVTTSNSKKIKQEYGTSFSTPLVAGFAACVMQLHPEWKNMEVFKELEKSGHLYPYYDYAHGYGVPQASYFISGKPEVSSTFEFKVTDESLRIICKKIESENHSSRKQDTLDTRKLNEITNEYQEKDTSRISLSNDKMETGDGEPRKTKSSENIANSGSYELDSNFLYFHILGKDADMLRRYGVVKMESSEEFNIPWEDLELGDRITVYYNGYINTFQN
jgi:hypothetical protein